MNEGGRFLITEHIKDWKLAEVDQNSYSNLTVGQGIHQPPLPDLHTLFLAEQWTELCRKDIWRQSYDNIGTLPTDASSGAFVGWISTAP
jgi:hypothetical protein